MSCGSIETGAGHRRDGRQAIVSESRTAGRLCAATWVLAAAMVLLTACAPRTKSGSTEAEAPQPVSPIQTDRDHYVLEPHPFGHVAMIAATFTAPKDTTVYVLHCNGAISWGLQRLEGGRWRDAWMAETNGCLSSPFVVPGGGTRSDTLGVISRRDVPLSGPVQQFVEPGTYRVVWYGVLTAFDLDARPFGPELSLERRVSGPITIELRR